MQLKDYPTDVLNRIQRDNGTDEVFQSESSCYVSPNNELGTRLLDFLRDIHEQDSTPESNDVDDLFVLFSQYADSGKEIKTEAIMDFVDSMIGAFDAGYVDRNYCALSEIYMVARHRVKDTYGIEKPTVIERYGEKMAVDIGLGKYT